MESGSTRKLENRACVLCPAAREGTGRPGKHLDVVRESVVRNTRDRHEMTWRKSRQNDAPRRWCIEINDTNICIYCQMTMQGLKCIFCGWGRGRGRGRGGRRTHALHTVVVRYLTMRPREDRACLWLGREQRIDHASVERK